MSQLPSRWFPFNRDGFPSIMHPRNSRRRTGANAAQDECTITSSRSEIRHLTIGLLQEASIGNYHLHCVLLSAGSETLPPFVPAEACSWTLRRCVTLLIFLWKQLKIDAVLLSVEFCGGRCSSPKPSDDGGNPTPIHFPPFPTTHTCKCPKQRSL